MGRPTVVILIATMLDYPLLVPILSLLQLSCHLQNHVPFLDIDIIICSSALSVCSCRCSFVTSCAIRTFCANYCISHGQCFFLTYSNPVCKCITQNTSYCTSKEIGMFHLFIGIEHMYHSHMYAGCQIYP